MILYFKNHLSKLRVALTDTVDKTFTNHFFFFENTYLKF